MNISIDAIIHELKKRGVSKEKAQEVYEAFLIADHIHAGVTRQSGEPYITHPLNVAWNVLKMEVYDPDTISAALLHDTIEDAHFSYEKEHIAQSINPTVAELVDGVTKMKGMEFSDKKEKQDANTRKIINGMTKDIRIIVIKLADRLHNMSTIEWKSPQKQKENAAETLELFVPLAIRIGAYQTKNQLEELSLQYLEPEVYKELKNRRALIMEKKRPDLEDMARRIQEELKLNGIDSDIVFRNRSIYTLFNKIRDGYKIENIFDLSYIKVLVDGYYDCYAALGAVHKLFIPANDIKDSLEYPRGFYQTFNTIVLDHNGDFEKVKIRTHDMDKRDSFGLIADLNKGRSMEDIQKEFREKHFEIKLQEIDDTFEDNSEYVKTVKADLLSEIINIYGAKGVITIPKGSTALDFVCEVLTYEELANLTSIVVNGIEVPFNHKLHNDDRVQIVCNGKIGTVDLTNSVTTEKAKLIVKRMNRENNTD